VVQESGAETAKRIEQASRTKRIKFNRLLRR
jgi:hypothetical protein